MFPAFLNLKGQLCLVVGGGPVGRRRATALLCAGAVVRLVCLEPPQPLDAPRQPDWRQERYDAKHLEGVVLAFAAGPPALNDQVADDARRRGVWVNVAHHPEAGDFFVPATLRRGELVIAIGTGGAAPGLARAVRERLEGEFDDAFAHWVALLAELRPLVLQIDEPQRRRALLADLVRWESLERIRAGQLEAVRTQMRQRIDQEQRGGR